MITRPWPVAFLGVELDGESAQVAFGIGSTELPDHYEKHRIRGVLAPGCNTVAFVYFEMSPVKRACFRHCRSPTEFLTHHWRKGRAGAFHMGIRHGIYCLGCCWMMMLLLFYGGIMNVYWIAGLSMLVLVEKIMPLRHWVTTLIGVTLIIWGGTLLAHLM